MLAYAGEYARKSHNAPLAPSSITSSSDFAVWLLLLLDRIKDDSIQITQERIAEHLGVRRAGVTVVAAATKDARAITYKRGKLRINDRQMLEAIACECYGTLAVSRQQTTYI